MRKVKLQNRQLLADTGRRLAKLFSDEMRISYAEAARRLQYVSPATLYAARDGKTIPHPEKLIGLMQLFHEETGKNLDLHWLLTGQGGPVYNSRQTDSPPSDNDIIATVQALNPYEKQALRLILGIKG